MVMIEPGVPSTPSLPSAMTPVEAQSSLALLLDTTYPISRIAYESGFQNLRSFNHYCQEIYHTTPRELRKNRLGR